MGISLAQAEILLSMMSARAAPVEEPKPRRDSSIAMARGGALLVLGFIFHRLSLDRTRIHVGLDAPIGKRLGARFAGRAPASGRVDRRSLQASSSPEYRCQSAYARCALPWV